MNVRDLIKFMAKHEAQSRSLIIHAAATSECERPTIVMERPLYEEKNASIPVQYLPSFTLLAWLCRLFQSFHSIISFFASTSQHWLRRQIGSILPENRDHPRKEWTTEEVRCVTPSDVLSDWSSQTKKGGLVSKQQQDMNGEIIVRYSVDICFVLSMRTFYGLSDCMYFWIVINVLLLLLNVCTVLAAKSKREGVLMC